MREKSLLTGGEEAEQEKREKRGRKVEIKTGVLKEGGRSSGGKRRSR